jgi:hypothetical protein
MKEQNTKPLLTTNSRTIREEKPPTLTPDEKERIEQQIVQLNAYHNQRDAQAFDRLYPQIKQYVSYVNGNYHLRDDIALE